MHVFLLLHYCQVPVWQKSENAPSVESIESLESADASVKTHIDVPTSNSAGANLLDRLLMTMSISWDHNSNSPGQEATQLLIIHTYPCSVSQAVS